MAQTITVSEFGNDYECREFFDTDLGGGIEVSNNGERLGSILGLSIPDKEDEDYEYNLKMFEADVIAWIVDNEEN